MSSKTSTKRKTTKITTPTKIKTPTKITTILDDFVEEQKEDLQIPPELVASERQAPSIITVAIISHGEDLESEPFFDPNVRIISFAGRTGSVYYGGPTTLRDINNMFEDQYSAYQKNIPIKGKKKFIEQLYADFPLANKCRKIPNFSFGESGAATQRTTYDFLSENFVNPTAKEDKPAAGNFFSLIPDFSIRGYKQMAQKKLSEIPKDQIKPYELLTQTDVTENMTHRIHTSVINKLYHFYDSSDPSFPARVHFGVHIMDICNYDNSTPKLGDNLLNSRAQYNKPFLAMLKENSNSVSLRDVVGFLHSLGFHTINIIDVACRVSRAIADSPRGTRRTRITELENEKFGEINLGYGLRRSNKSKRHNKSKKHKKHNRSKKHNK